MLELVYLVALLGRKCVFVLVAGSGLEQHNDFYGVSYETYVKAGTWKRYLANELAGQCFYINLGALKKIQLT